MKRFLCGELLAALLVGSMPAFGHDLFLVVDDHSVAAEKSIDISLVNGTFDKSENAISRDRMVNVSWIDGGGKVTAVKDEQWRDEGLTAMVRLNSGAPGTAVLGVSTAPRLIEMSADDFNSYLRNDGIVDTLAQRRAADELQRDARESYAKHVKTLLQVGGGSSDAWQTVFGYPVEFVPSSNPFDLLAGDKLQLRVLANGQPLAGQLVYASHEDYHGHGADGSHKEAVSTRSDDQGLVQIPLNETGRWYVRLIHMVEDPTGEYDYISQWATLTFGVGQ